MENFNEMKLKLLEDIEKLIKAINDDIDWFIASFREKDSNRRVIARYFSSKKEKELAQLAKEVYEKYK
jgi:hypothetical protein